MIAWCVVFVGVAVMTFCAVTAALLPRVFDRLHLLTATTSFGVPLIGAGLMLSQGWTGSSAMIALTVVFTVLSAPVISAATGRLAAQHEGLVDQDSPS